MERVITIKSTKGLHASLAAKVVEIATKHEAEVKLYYGDAVVDLKSLLSLISLAIPEGVNVKIVATGKDREKAIREIVEILG